MCFVQTVELRNAIKIPSVVINNPTLLSYDNGTRKRIFSSLKEF